MSTSVANVINMLPSDAQRLDGDDGDFDVLVDAARDRTFVLLGEATHGTHEFYRMRSAITRRLIEECGFDAVIHVDGKRAVEPLGDEPSRKARAA